MRTYNDKITVILKNGKQVKRTLRTNSNGWTFVVYNGQRIGVEFYNGRFHQVYN